MLNLAYSRVGIVVRRESVGKHLVLFIVERCAFFVSTLGPSNRVTWPCIAASSVETREPEDAWTSVGSPLKHCRLRLPSLVQSSPFLLLLVSCVRLPCCPCCACSFVLLVVCNCFRVFLSISASLGFQSSLLVVPGEALYLSALLCLSPSLSCLWSCRCLDGSQSCINSLPFVHILCPAQPLDLSSLNVVRVLPGQSWLVFRCGVGWDGIVVGAFGGGVGFGAARPVRWLLLVPCRSLPRVFARWWFACTSTLGIELLVSIELIANPLGTSQPNKDLLEIAVVQGTDRTMNVANSGGTQRLDPDQVIFGRFTKVFTFGPFSSCPGDGGMAGDVTLVGSLGGCGETGNLVENLTFDVGETTVNFIFRDVSYKIVSWQFWRPPNSKYGPFSNILHFRVEKGRSRLWFGCWGCWWFNVWHFGAIFGSSSRNIRLIRRRGAGRFSAWLSI